LESLCCYGNFPRSRHKYFGSHGIVILVKIGEGQQVDGQMIIDSWN